VGTRPAARSDDNARTNADPGEPGPTSTELKVRGDQEADGAGEGDTVGAGVSVADGDVWVVGNQGFVAKLPGGQNPTIIPTPDQRWLVSVYAASATDLWVVGRSGAILRGPPGARGVGDGGAH